MIAAYASYPVWLGDSGAWAAAGPGLMILRLFAVCMMPLQVQGRALVMVKAQ
ncbi:hypothetical protein [Anaerobiospirillum sp. NML120449]|uniref:hypothetical protein n=1 Tax=Anaerobiospirillum sp. NML120449 TaxID=2932817 RepID=UPI001FF45B4B|nr:hypothetical protein [Anaerobiospirillum sp. NML120449]MCK0527054.1 hypothetical protein [Anaerobiospirillum sp. NML120449]